jgi:diguanylate cyclase (GGDEF)-like protein
MTLSWWQTANALMFGGAVISIVLAALMWRRPVPGHGWAVLTMIAMGESEGFWAFENLAAGMSAKIEWAKLEYLGIATAPLLLFLFVMTYTGQYPGESVIRMALLWVVPAVTIVLTESMVDGVLVIDARGRIVDSNPAAMRFLSASGTPLTGKDACDVLGDLSEQLYAPEPAVLAGFEMAAPADAQLRIEVQAIPLQAHKLSHGTLLVLRDITQRWRAEAELRAQLQRNLDLQETLREQAVRDSLTGLFNRRFLQESLTRELARAFRSGTSMALVVIDLDNFKTVNDEFGHGAGDRVLQAVARLLQTGTRSGDVLCRYGGEEFVVVLPTAEASDALRRVEQWRHDVEHMSVEYEGIAIRVTMSAGVSAYPSCGGDVDEILRAADRALYDAKHAGRNLVSSAGRKEDRAVR